MHHMRLDPYLLDVLLRDLAGHDHRPSAFIVYLCLWCRTFGVSQRSVSLSLQRLAEATGLSKSGVQAALRHLLRRKLLRIHHPAPTAVPEYFVLRPWSTRR